MSYAAEKWAREQTAGNARAKAVLIELANCLNDNTGKCCPSVAYLSRVTELKPDTISLATRFLEKKGLIKKHFVKTRNGRAIQYELVGYHQKRDNLNIGDTPENVVMSENRDNPGFGTTHTPENGGTDTPENGGTDTPENGDRTSNKEQVIRTSNKESDWDSFLLTPENGDTPNPEKPKDKTRGTSFTLETIPADWIEAAEKLAPDLDAQKLFEEFADYWKAVPGARGRKKDWLATFRNHIRNLPDWKRKNFRKTNSYREPETREQDFSKIDYGESGLLSDFKF